MVFQQDRNAMTTQRLFGQRTGALGHQVPVPQPNGLFIEPGIPDDGGRNLRIVRLDDSHTIFRQILMPDLEGGSMGHRLDHLRIQYAQTVSATRDLIAHMQRP